MELLRNPCLNHNMTTSLSVSLPYYSDLEDQSTYLFEREKQERELCL